MRRCLLLFGLLGLVGCQRADEPPAAETPLDIETARAALLTRINNSPKGFASYGEANAIQALSDAVPEPISEEGEYDLAFKGIKFLQGFRINLKKRTYVATIHLPMGTREGGVLMYKAEEYSGTFSFHAESGVWEASPATAASYDAPSTK
jgi:hypothetical protein